MLKMNSLGRGLNELPIFSFCPLPLALALSEFEKNPIETSVLHALDETENSYLISILFCPLKIQLVGCMYKP